MSTVKFAVPKGSIETATFKILEEAWQSIVGSGRTYRIRLSDPEIEVKVLRPQEIPTYVQEGFYDIGITGKDWIREAKADVRILLDLEYGRVKQVFAIPEHLESNKLKIIDTVMESTAVLVANNTSLKDAKKREKIADMVALLKGVVEGRKKLHIFVNVKKENLNSLLASMPALKKPTISTLSEDGWFGVNTIIDKNEFIQIVPIMRKLAQGLVVMDPRQILPLDEINLDNYSDEPIS